jgi:hypothetical protein
VTVRATEAQCQRTIVEAARLGGWMIYHNRPAQNSAGRWRTALQGHAGFPDLVLVHPDARLVWFVEIKRKPNKLAPDQLVWRTALEEAGADYRLVWVPEEQDEFCQELVSQRRVTVIVTRWPPAAPDPSLFDWDGET